MLYAILLAASCAAECGLSPPHAARCAKYVLKSKITYANGTHLSPAVGRR